VPPTEHAKPRFGYSPRDDGMTFRGAQPKMKRIILNTATVLLGTMAYVLVGIALASAG